MTWLLNFLLVMSVEYTQNLPTIIGIVLGLSALKRGLAWWKSLLFFAGGSFLSAFLITGTEWIKVMGTTRTAEPPSLSAALFMGVLFTVGCLVIVLYFRLTDRLKRTYLADILFGVSLVALTAVVESFSAPPELVVLHALGFAAAGSVLIILFRRSADLKPGRAMAAPIALLTLLMTLLIVLFDYLPFIKS